MKREKGSVALVYPYFMTGAERKSLFQPIGIAALASQCRERGIAARQFDCTFSDFNRITAAIASARPAVVGMYVMATMSGNATALIKALRPLLPNALFVAGGPLPTLYPERFSALFDAVFRGEADGAFPDFAFDDVSSAADKRFRAERFADVPGLYISDETAPVDNPPVHRDEAFLDRLPFPDRAGVPVAPYQRFWKKKCGLKPATVMLTYGCPYACDFCSKPVFGDRLRKRDLPRVMAEIRGIIGLGYDSLWIADDCLTLDRDYLAGFCRALTDSRLAVPWSCLTRVDKIDMETARLMKGAGCYKVYCGLESGSDRTLGLMRKRASVEEGVRAVEIFHRTGLAVGGFFMVGYPGETAASIESTFDLALSLPLDEISFTVPYPLRGSPLYERLGRPEADGDWEYENEVKFLFHSEFDARVLRERIRLTMDRFAAKKNTARRDFSLDHWVSA